MTSPMMIPVLLLLNLVTPLMKKGELQLTIVNKATRIALKSPGSHPVVMCQNGFQVLQNILTSHTKRMKKELCKRSREGPQSVKG